MKTSELTGAALDWAVAKCEEVGGQAYLREDPNPASRIGAKILYDPLNDAYLCYSTNWAQGGPIIEREKICLVGMSKGGWKASIGQQDYSFASETPLLAAMRCYVASKLGDEVEIPEELL